MDASWLVGGSEQCNRLVQISAQPGSFCGTACRRGNQSWTRFHRTQDKAKGRPKFKTKAGKGKRQNSVALQQAGLFAPCKPHAAAEEPCSPLDSWTVQRSRAKPLGMTSLCSATLSPPSPSLSCLHQTRAEYVCMSWSYLPMPMASPLP